MGKSYVSCFLTHGVVEYYIAYAISFAVTSVDVPRHEILQHSDWPFQ